MHWTKGQSTSITLRTVSIKSGERTSASVKCFETAIERSLYERQ